MESPAQTCARLLVALEELVAQEAGRLEARDFAAVVRIQERAAPLIEHLAVHGREISDEAFRARVRAVLARRQRTGEWLGAQLARVREELRQTVIAQRRMAQMAPAYAGMSRPRRQLSAIG